MCMSWFFVFFSSLQWYYPERTFSLHKHLSCTQGPLAFSRAALTAASSRLGAHSAASRCLGIHMHQATIKLPVYSCLVTEYQPFFFFFILHEVTFLPFKWEVTSANSVLAPFMQRNQEGRKRRCGRFETKQNKLKLPCGCGADSCCPPTQAACPWRMDFICLSILWVLFQKGEGKQATKRSAVAGKLVINRRAPPWHDGGAAASLKFACLYGRMSWCDRHRDLRQIFSCLGSPLLLQCLHGIAELYWAFSTKCISTVHVHRPSRKIKFALHSSTEILPGQSRTAPAKIFLLLSPLFSLKL